MNKYVAPHLLVSVSIFEDEHPKKSALNCVIVHCDAAEDAAKADEGRSIYQFDKVDKTSSDSWDECFNEMAETINKKQDGRESHVACATVTQNDSKLLVRISYDSLEAQKIKDQMRPAGCCTLF